MTIQNEELELDRCPHCAIAAPRLTKRVTTDTNAHSGGNPRRWIAYGCQSCGGVVLTAGRIHPATTGALLITEQYPAGRSLIEDIPDRAREALKYAQDTLNAPPASIVMAARAIDAMLKARGYKEGALFARIDQAAADHVLTPDMAQWAHDVRLDANDQRHADEDAPMPTADDAMRALEFALALAEYLFVLPARVKRGRRKGGGT